MSRLLETPEHVRVEVAAGVPARVATGEGRRPALRVCARWRVETDWWRTPVSREYWKLELGGGSESLLCDVYQDRLTGEWWLSRLYD
ncbi:MAG TPA: hypothetical protein VIN56_05250 [Candidatus Dormibacteraeota bacterium]|jgi:hypothetical protein